MREILFRGKRIDNGEFVCGYVGVFKGTTQIYVPFTEEEEKENEGHIFSVIGGLWHTVHHETIGQFTGLTDSNGKRIFEGDFVRMKYAVNGRKRAFIKGVVKYEKGAFFVHFSSHGRKTEGLLWGFTSSFHTEDEGLFCEIIGNIHDNPDLLNK